MYTYYMLCVFIHLCILYMLCFVYLLYITNDMYCMLCVIYHILCLHLFYSILIYYTGRVCIPIDPKAAEEFDPFSVPTLRVLCEEVCVYIVYVYVYDVYSVRYTLMYMKVDECVYCICLIFILLNLYICASVYIGR